MKKLIPILICIPFIIIGCKDDDHKHEDCDCDEKSLTFEFHKHSTDRGLVEALGPKDHEPGHPGDPPPTPNTRSANSTIDLQKGGTFDKFGVVKYNDSTLYVYHKDDQSNDLSNIDPSIKVYFNLERIRLINELNGANLFIPMLIARNISTEPAKGKVEGRFVLSNSDPKTIQGISNNGILLSDDKTNVFLSQDYYHYGNPKDIVGLYYHMVKATIYTSQGSTGLNISVAVDIDTTHDHKHKFWEEPK